MTIKIYWAEENRIMRWDFSGRWTWKEFMASKAESDAMIRNAGRIVNIIGDLTESSLLPRNAFSVYKTILKSVPENTGLIVLVQASPFVRNMVDTFTRFFPAAGPGSNFAFADSVPQALALLKSLQTAPLGGKQ